jgi:hypothetical protein
MNSTSRDYDGSGQDSSTITAEDSQEMIGPETNGNSSETMTGNDTTAVGISLADMDGAIQNIRDLEANYKAAKEISDAHFAELSSAKEKVMDMLEQAEKTVYVAEGVGRVTLSYEMSVQTPKTPSEKKAFFSWLASKMGQEVADAYTTVNSQALNSLYNSLTEEYASRGEILMIDGLSEPIARRKLSLRKA